MAYRELYTNALDENGYVLNDVPVPMPGTTVVSVEGERFLDVYETRWSYFINPSRRPIYKDSRVEIYEGSNNRIFYRGVAVYKPQMPTAFTYNVLAHCNLTEDRTASEFELFFQIHQSLKLLQDKNMTRRYLSIPEGNLEHEVSWYGGETSKDFGVLFRQVWTVAPQLVNASIKLRVERDSRMDDSEMTDEVLTPAQETCLRDALKVAQFVGIEVRREKVRVVKEITGSPRIVKNKLYFNKQHLDDPEFQTGFLISASGLCCGMDTESKFLAKCLKALGERLWQFENQSGVN